MKREKKIAIVLVFVMIVMLMTSEYRKVEAENAYGLNNPSMTYAQTTWDCIYFGNYWSIDTNGDDVVNQEDNKQPIRWRVLEIEGDEALLLSDQILECMAYQSPFGGVTWENCLLRTWLNKTFFEAAFGSEEQNQIVTTSVQHKVGTAEECYVEDKVYVLSEADAGNSAYGFESIISSSYTRAVESTDYAKAHGVAFETTTDVNGDEMETGQWWLRIIPESTTTAAACVYEYGYTSADVEVNRSDVGVRPVIRLNLSNTELWEKGGQVVSPAMIKVPQMIPTVSPTSIPAASKKPVIVPTNMPTSSTEPTFVPVNTLTPNTEPTGTPASVPVEEERTGTVSEPTPAQSADDTTQKIKVSQVKQLSLQAKKNCVTAKWKKISGVKGYQISYSVSRKFKTEKRKIAKKNKIIIKKLKKNKKYYVRVRAYKMQNGKKVYGKWSAIAKIKTKK